jgi:5S rRNA maturation endonuclease (ribonuclease M5)
MTSNSDRGIIDTLSNHSVNETVERLKGILQAKGVTIFAIVDHSGEAAKVGAEDASDQARHLRQPQSRNTFNVSRSERRHRPPT